MRSIWFGAAAIAVLSLSSVDAALAAKCKSIQARCAIEAGGKCDRESGHWCYGIFKGENCGGSPAAFRTCMARNGHPRNGDAQAAIASAPGKCTSAQARCIIEAGGYCNPRTGAWRLGFVYQHYYGGNHQAFIACLDRAMAEGKLKQ